MATSLPALGTASYNGFTFPAETETLDISARPIPDAAKRTIVYVEYTLRLRAYILASPGNSIDLSLEAIRRQLLAQGGALVYSGRGFGDLQINTGTTRDVLWGPVPAILSWKPKGGNKAAEIVWEVTFRIPECSGAVTSGLFPMEYSFRVNYTIDRSGYTSRTIFGHVSVPATRATQGGRSLPYTVDQIREQIVPEIPSGFRRTTQTYTPNEAKTRLDFTITDEEMPPDVPPPGVIDVKASMTISLAKPPSFNRWQVTINASYEMARDQPRSRAFELFIALANDKVQKIRGGPLAAQHMIPVAFTMQEPLYDRQAAVFSLSFLTTTSVGILTSGLWEPLPGSNWATWRASVARQLGPRGNADLRLGPADDVIVDLCAPQGRTLTAGGLPGQVRQLTAVPINVPCPPAAESWLHFENAFSWEAEEGTATLRTLGPVTPAAFTGSPGDTGFVPSGPVGPVATIQNRTAPAYAVRITGEAMRVCHEIPEPTLRSVGGVEVTPANGKGDYFVSKAVANCGVPLFYARWSRRYVMPQLPGAFGTPPVPATLTRANVSTDLTSTNSQRVLVAVGGYNLIPNQ
jgi:hypothetical protein